MFVLPIPPSSASSTSSASVSLKPPSPYQHREPATQSYKNNPHSMMKGNGNTDDGGDREREGSDEEEDLEVVTADMIWEGFWSVMQNPSSVKIMMNAKMHLQLLTALASNQSHLNVHTHMDMQGMTGDEGDMLLYCKKTGMVLCAGKLQDPRLVCICIHMNIYMNE